MSTPPADPPSSWWSLTCELLDRFAAGPATTTPIARADARYDRWMTLRDRADALLGRSDRPDPAPPPATAGALRSLVAGAPDPPDAAHAVAWLLDERFSRTFPDDWIAAAPDGGHVLVAGEPYPVLDTPWTIFEPYISMPASLTDPGRDELPHVRRFRPTAAQLARVARVEIHHVKHLLRDVLAPLTAIATGHPNLRWDELEWPAGTSLWPVRPRDAGRQTALLDAIAAAALGSGCRLLVLPELSATEDGLTAIQRLIDDLYDERGEAAIVVAGSRHETVDGVRRNRAHVLLGGTALRLSHDKLTQVRLGDSIEDLGDPAPPLRLYQDGPFRLAVAICKDMLDSHVVQLFGDLGVTLLLVPAMSDKTDGFPASAAQLARVSQTLSAFANGPLLRRDGQEAPVSSLMVRATRRGAESAWPSESDPDPDGPAWVEHRLAARTCVVRPVR